MLCVYIYIYICRCCWRFVVEIVGFWSAFWDVLVFVSWWCSLLSYLFIHGLGTAANGWKGELHTESVDMHQPYNLRMSSGPSAVLIAMYPNLEKSDLAIHSRLVNLQLQTTKKPSIHRMKRMTTSKPKHPARYLTKPSSEASKEP